MIRSCWRNLTITLVVIPDEEFPPIGRVLQMIQIKGNQVIEKRALHLSAKNIELRS